MKSIADPRYILCPGDVISDTDGDIHFISAVRLVKLYRLPREATVVYVSRTGHYPIGFVPDPERDVVLRPDPTGRYTLPEPKKPPTLREFRTRRVTIRRDP